LKKLIKCAGGSKENKGKNIFTDKYMHRRIGFLDIL